MGTAWIFALAIMIGIPVIGLILNRKYGKQKNCDWYYFR
jgi:Mrp family chromosome partitioning ATPase